MTNDDLSPNDPMSGTGRESIAPAGGSSGVDPKLLEFLVCPMTKGPLRYDAEHQELISERARIAYPIRDGIPIMLVDEARSLDQAGSAPQASA